MQRDGSHYMSGDDAGMVPRRGQLRCALEAHSRLTLRAGMREPAPRVWSVGAGSAGAHGEHGCTGRERASAAKNASTLTSATSEVSDVADITEVKSHELGIRNMGGAAPGISL